MNIQIIKRLKERAKEMLEDNYDRKIGVEGVYTIICELENFYTAYEKEKEEREIIGKLYYEANENCIKYEKMIENQQKEIEELKKPKYIMNFETGKITKLTNDFVSKDKIKAKIEEYRKQIEELKDLNIFTYTEYEGAIKFGESLLKEE